MRLLKNSRGWLVKFFDSDSKQSMTRLCTWILVVSGVVMAFVYPDYETGYLGVIGLGLGGKVTQKYFENDKTDNDNSISDSDDGIRHEAH